MKFTRTVKGSLLSLLFGKYRSVTTFEGTLAEGRQFYQYLQEPVWFEFQMKSKNKKLFSKEKPTQTIGNTQCDEKPASKQRVPVQGVMRKNKSSAQKYQGECWSSLQKNIPRKIHSSSPESRSFHSSFHRSEGGRSDDINLSLERSSFSHRGAV